MKKASYKFIHLLYAPTNFCNMGCKYCYLGTGTDEVSDHRNALETLEYTVDKFLVQKTLPFNISFHGGEATTIPEQNLRELLVYSQAYYQKYGKIIKEQGYSLNPVHIKTNLYNFDKLYGLFEEFGVSISGSVDLPLSLHEKYRTNKGGHSTLPKIKKNLELLAKYPHHKKISCVVTQEHMLHLDEFIEDIKHIHYGIGLDMTKFNIMFSFDSNKNEEKFDRKIPGTEMLSQEQQVQLYKALTKAFKGTELEEGLGKHWFKEFTPEFCCSAVNCGDKFFLLQQNGDVYACPRGQSSREFYYGNVFKNTVQEVLNKGRQTIELIENRLEADAECYECNYLPYCNQGCVFVREQTGLKKSYTCKLQKELYKADPERYPAYTDEQIRHYARQYKFANNINNFKENEVQPKKNRYITPELEEDKNALSQIIQNDPILKQLYADDMFFMEIDQESYPMTSPILSNSNAIAMLSPGSRAVLKVRADIFEIHCNEPVTNFLHLMLLRNTPVTYGDESREKQEHIVDYSLYQKSFIEQSELKGDYYQIDLMPFFILQQSRFIKGVRNNLFASTKYIREYHYLKQKKNAFYHIQAINLPFPYLEFYWGE